MKTKHLLPILTGLITLLLSPTARSEELGADAIIERANQAAYYAGTGGKADVRMEIIDAKGGKRVREFRILRLNTGDTKQKFYVYFKEPADVRKMAYLVWKNPEADDDRWLWMPALNLVKRIAPGDKRTSFVGSDFVYEDVSGRSPKVDTHELVETTDAHYVIKNTPKDAGTVEFSSYTVWIDKQSFLPRKAEYLDKNGKPYRRVSAEKIETIDGIPTVMESLVEDLVTGGKTLNTFSGVEYQVKLSERLFSERFLRRPPARGHPVKKIALLTLLLAPALYAQVPLDLHGFADARIGLRTDADPGQEDRSLTEFRLQLEREAFVGPATLQFRGDLLYDELENDHDIDLEDGEGWFDLREANLLVSPHEMIDLKAGRQILTWGTGDLVFINDQFPKDWVSFFSGRDEEYLKAPSDALFVSAFPDVANIDLAYTPRFDADRFITGERIAFFQPMGPGIVVADQPDDWVPDDWFDDDEWALRLSRNVSSTELALYGYDGFWKSPAGSDPDSGQARFPRLRSVGASARGALSGGIGKLELGYYDSRDDSNGDDPFIRNSEFRGLAGYERSLAADLTLALQYYLEYMDDHAAYRASLPAGLPARDEDRHLLTARLTWQLMNQNLTLSLVGFWSPSDADGYLRPNAAYKVSDDWLLTAGANLFAGDEDHTFFNQFESNNNVYAGTRYSF